MTQAADAIEEYMRRKQVGRTRLQPRGATKQIDPKLPGVLFWRFADGSAIRMDSEGDPQEF